jgi:hypothetical protein
MILGDAPISYLFPLGDDGTIRDGRCRASPGLAEFIRPH